MTTSKASYGSKKTTSEAIENPDNEVIEPLETEPLDQSSGPAEIIGTLSHINDPVIKGMVLALLLMKSRLEVFEATVDVAAMAKTLGISALEVNQALLDLVADKRIEMQAVVKAVFRVERSPHSP